jgi:hypothetical protein
MGHYQLRRSFSLLGRHLVANNSVTFVKTSPFEGRAVGFGPDGTIWVLDLEVGPGRGKEPAADHYRIQAFGPNDVRKAEYLLQSHSGCELAAQINGIPRVIATDDRKGLFAPFCRTGLDTAGNRFGQWCGSTVRGLTRGGRG